MRQYIIKISLIILLSVSLCNFLNAQFKSESNSTISWSAGTAQILPEGRIETGVFQPLRYGYNNSLELSLHPLLFFIMPNLNAKWFHTNQDGFIISSEHGFLYPTYLLRTIARKGEFGIISPEFKIPQMFSMYNGIIVSKSIFSKHLLTLKAGFDFSLKEFKPDKRTTIDLPLVFSRLQVFYNNYDLLFGLDLEGKLYERWKYLIDADVFVFPGAQENFSFEHKGMLYWNKSEGFQFCLGYKLVFGEYPFGNQWHLLPLIDVSFAW